MSLRGPVPSAALPEEAPEAMEGVQLQALVALFRCWRGLTVLPRVSPQL